MKDIKNSFTVDFIDYAIGDNIQHGLWFTWWMPYTINNQYMVFLRSNINIGPGLISMGCFYPSPFMRKIILTRRTITIHGWIWYY